MTEAEALPHAAGPGDEPLWEWQSPRGPVVAARMLVVTGLAATGPLLGVGVAGLVDDCACALCVPVGFTLALVALGAAFQPMRFEVFRDRLVATAVLGQVRQWAPDEVGTVAAECDAVRLAGLKLLLGTRLCLPLDESQQGALREVLAKVGGPTAEDWVSVRRKGLWVSVEWPEGPKVTRQNGAAAPPPPLSQVPLAEWAMPEERVRRARQAPVVLGVMALVLLPVCALIEVWAARMPPPLGPIATLTGATLLLFGLVAAGTPLEALARFRRCAVYADRIVLERIAGPTRELLPGDIALAEVRTPATLRFRLRSGWLGKTVSVTGPPSVMRRLFAALEQLGVPTEVRQP